MNVTDDRMGLIRGREGDKETRTVCENQTTQCREKQKRIKPRAKQKDTQAQLKQDIPRRVPVTIGVASSRSSEASCSYVGSALSLTQAKKEIVVAESSLGNGTTD